MQDLERLPLWSLGRRGCKATAAHEVWVVGMWVRANAGRKKRTQKAPPGVLAHGQEGTLWVTWTRTGELQGLAPGCWGKF